MSKEAWIRKFNEWQPEGNNNYKIINEKHCEEFEANNKGYCKHYMGCKIVNRTCSEECDIKRVIK